MRNLAQRAKINFDFHPVKEKKKRGSLVDRKAYLLIKLIENIYHVEKKQEYSPKGISVLYFFMRYFYYHEFACSLAELELAPSEKIHTQITLNSSKCHHETSFPLSLSPSRALFYLVSKSNLLTFYCPSSQHTQAVN